MIAVKNSNNYFLNGEKMESELSEKQKADYVKGHGSECPYCGSSEINLFDFENDGKYFKSEKFFNDMVCEDCGRRWTEEYILNNIF